MSSFPPGRAGVPRAAGGRAGDRAWEALRSLDLSDPGGSSHLRGEGLRALTLVRGLHVWKGVIRKLKSGEYRLYSRKQDPKTGKRRNLGTFKTLAAAKKHEKAVQYFKRH